MSSWGVTAPSEHTPPERRIRHHVKDGFAVIAASALTSTSVAIALLLITKLAS